MAIYSTEKEIVNNPFINQPVSYASYSQAAGIKPIVKPVTSISTSKAISNLNQDKARLDELSKPKQYEYAPGKFYDEVAFNAMTPEQRINLMGLDVAKTSIPKTTAGTVSYTNTNGQEAEFTADQLKDQSTQDFLSQGGYVMTKASGTTPDATQTGLESSVSGYNKQMEDLVSGFNSSNIDQDPEFQAISSNIKQKFAKMTEDMKRTNEQRESAYKSLGYRQGTTQYAGGVQLGIEGEELNQANARLSEIASQEASALSAAREAFRTGKYEQFSQQMSMIEKLRANKQEELSTYNQKLAAADAKLQANKEFEFEVYKYMQDQAAAQAEKAKPITLSPGQTIYDPNTNEAIYTAPERPSDNKPITEKVGDSLIQWNPNTGGWDTVFAGGTAQGVSDDAMSWATLISNGTYKPSDVPDELKKEVANVMAKMPPSEKAINDAQKMIDSIKLLKEDPGINAAVGPAFTGAISRTWLSEPFTGRRSIFLGKANQLVSNLALSKLIEAKSQGATFGALSDREMDILKSAQTALGTWEIRDKDGRVTGYKTTEKGFKNELQRLIDDYQSLVDEARGTTGGNSFDSWYSNQAPESDLNAINNMLRDSAYGNTIEERKKKIGEMYGQSFSQGGSGTPIATLNKVSKIPVGQKAGQCGRFVNKLTGLGLGDSFQSKMSKMNQAIKYPQSGMAFVMPYKNTGHTGIILSVNNGVATVKDSNWSLDEKVKVHQIPVSKMTGFAYPKIA